MNQRKLQQTLELGLAHHQRGEAEEAARLYAQVRQAAPRLFDGWHLAGALAYQQGRTAEAVELLSRARRLDPASAPCKLFLGMALADLGRFAEAESPLRSALQALPDHPEAWINLARTVQALGRPGREGVDCLRRAVALEPGRAEIHERLGELVAASDGLPAAEPHFRRATELQPGLACAWTNLGLALAESPGRYRESVDCVERAVQADPGSAEALAGRALVRLNGFAQEDADRDYAAALRLEPANPRILSARAMLSNYLSGRSRESVLAAHVAAGRAFAAENAMDFRQARDPERRLRVGFVSPDLRAHPVASFFEPLLQSLDPDRFEVILYHTDPRTDAVSERLRQRSASWRNLHGLSDDAADKVVRADAPDLLVDLAGHSAGNRLALFARRLAPVQATYLGYPHTTGLPAIDFRFTDAIADPAGEADRFATERLVRFAPTAWAFQPDPDVPEVSPGPSAAEPITFGSFNNFTKVTDEMLRVWAALLDRVPRSRLLLKSRFLDEPAVAALVRARVRAAGLDEQRVELAPPVPQLRGHLETYARVDVALDPFPYHGTTTTCEALWMGVPVVTLAGDRHAARVGCSLLTAVGHPEWIARTEDDYVALAADLAADRRRLQELRSSLRPAMRASPLLDHAGQAARFGAALRNCWREWCGARATPASAPALCAASA